jgi:hypothetical protein
MTCPRHSPRSSRVGDPRVSDSGEGTASGDYDNETAGLEEKLLEGKLASIDHAISKDFLVDGSEASLDEWEADGGRQCGDPTTS